MATLLFSLNFQADNNLKNIMANYVYLSALSNQFHVRMRKYSHSSTKVLFLCSRAHTDIFSRNYTQLNLEYQPVSEMSKFAKKARNLDGLSVPIRRMFLRDRHHCTKWSIPLQLSPVCFTLQKQDGQIEEQVAQEGNNRSPEEQLAQGINIIWNSKRPLVELLKLLELELKSKPVSA